MSVLFVLVPAALLVVITAIFAYVWAARRGQFDDLDTPAMRMLHDDEPTQTVRRPIAQAPPDMSAKENP